VSGLNLLVATYLFYCEVKHFAEAVIHCQFGLERFCSTCTGKWAIMYLFVRYFDCVSFYWILGLFRKCDICNLSFHNQIYHNNQSIKRWQQMFITSELVLLFISLKLITMDMLAVKMLEIETILYIVVWNMSTYCCRRCKNSFQHMCSTQCMRDKCHFPFHLFSW
jgi:hypothetical protein